MKKILIIATTFASVIFTSCSKDWLSTKPTASDSSSVLYEMGVQGADMVITGLNRYRFTYFKSGGLSLSDIHMFGCGERSTDIMVDGLAGDFLSSSNKLTPIQAWGMVEELHVTMDNSKFVTVPWHYYYNVIDKCNIFLYDLDNRLYVGMDGAAAQFNFYRAQALIYRALSLHRLVQIYGKPIHSDPNALGVVLKTDLSLDHLPRSTVRQTYDRIFADLHEAQYLLEGNPTTPRDKTMANINVVYGLLARVYACTHEWNLCEQYARQARSGIQLMTPTQFCDGFSIVNNEWMWASIAPSEEHQNAANFYAFMSNGTSYPQAWGYDVCISKDLCNHAPLTDCRIYGNAANGEAMAKEFSPLGYDAAYKLFRYNKFFLDGMQNFAEAYMRGAEMLLLEAEAKLSKGTPDYTGARILLNELMASRADEPEFADDIPDNKLLDEVKIQTRIELWCEGGSAYFNIKRRGDNINLTDGHTGQEPQYLGRLATEIILPSDKYMIWLIPQRETLYNENIVQN